MDIKIKLDTEIQAYRALLDGEETRLGITHISSPNVSTSSSSPIKFSDSHSFRSAKRRRLSESSNDEQDRSTQLLQVN